MRRCRFKKPCRKRAPLSSASGQAKSHLLSRLLRVQLVPSSMTLLAPLPLLGQASAPAGLGHRANVDAGSWCCGNDRRYGVNASRTPVEARRQHPEKPRAAPFSRPGQGKTSSGRLNPSATTRKRETKRSLFFEITKASPRRERSESSRDRKLRLAAEVVKDARIGTRDAQFPPAGARGSLGTPLKPLTRSVSHSSPSGWAPRPEKRQDGSGKYGYSAPVDDDPTGAIKRARRRGNACVSGHEKFVQMSSTRKRSPSQGDRRPLLVGLYGVAKVAIYGIPVGRVC